MDFINKKSFCAQFFSQFPSIKLETIKTLCSNGFETYYQLIGLNIDSDLPFSEDISLGQKALIRKALIQLNSHSDNGFNYQFNHSFISFNNNNNNYNNNDIIESNVNNCDNVLLDEQISHKKTSIAFICLDNETDDEVDYEDINRLRDQQFINQKENNYFNNDLKQEIKNECKTSLEFGFNSQLIDQQNSDSNELTINMKTESKKIKRRRKSKEVIPLSLIKSRQMPDCDYYKLLKTVRMPTILINRLIIDQQLRDKFIEYKNWFRTKRRNSGKKTESKLINDKIKGPFKCDYSDCGYSGPNAHYLRMHKYRHTGERHIACHWPGCQFSSIWRHSVREHYYTHTNEKPHKCGWNGCQYSSAQSGNLAKHKRIHFGDKPYLCHWLGCSQKFNNNQSLHTHLRIKHNYIPIEDSNDVIIDNNNKSSYERIEENINEFFDKEVDAQNNFEINLSHFTDNTFLTENNQNSIENISHNFDNHFTSDFSFNNHLVKDSVEKVNQVLKKRRVSPQKLSHTDINSMNESIDKVINDCLKEEFIDNTIESNDSTKLNEKYIQNTNSFKCLWPECDYNNEDSIEFEKHSQTHVPKKRRISSDKAEAMCCWPGCQYKTKYSRLLKDHQNAHNGIRHHKCNHCDYNSSYFGDIRRHMNKNHSLIFEEIKRNRKLKQMETKNKSKKSRTLSEESELYINETICEVIDKAMDETNCQLISDNNSQLLSQMKLKVIDKPNGEVINGTICEDINQNEQLISCMSVQQTGELKPYFCGWSGCAFSTIDSDLFLRHRREHIGGELQYHCDQQQCYYETNRFNSLIIHKRRYHRIETFENNCETILENNLEPSILTIDHNSQQLINGFNYDFELKNDFFSNDEYFYEQNFF